ncbi:MAG: hypothetical protein ACC661_00975 [Verrucomicrobiales bacterium]
MVSLISSSRFRVGVAVFRALAASLIATTAAAVAQEEFEPLEEVTSPLMAASVDGNGNHWMLSRNGHVDKSGNKLLIYAQRLSIDGVEWAAVKAWRIPGETRWRLEGSRDDLEIERDIFFDAERGGVRVVDRFRNTGGSEKTVTIDYASSFQSPWREIYNAQGRDFDDRFGSRDTGLFVRMADENENQGVLFIAAGDRSGFKPVFSLGEKRDFNLQFTLPIPPGEARSLAHWVVQRRLAGPEEIPALAAAFYRQRHLVDGRISRKMVGEIVNFDLASASAGEVEPQNAQLLVALGELVKRLGVIRTGQDLLWVAPESQLSGSMEGGALTVASRFGEFEVPLAEVAAIRGGGGRWRPQRLFLRDGSVIQGEIRAQNLKLKGGKGWALDLAIGQIEYLVAKVAVSDGRTSDGVTGFVRLHSGDVFDVMAREGDVLRFMAPWGVFEVPFGAIRSLSYLSAPSPRYRLHLKDGSRITGFLEDGELTLNSSRFGAVQLASGEVAGFWLAGDEAPEIVREIEEIDDIGDSAIAVCLLKGDNLVAGRLGNSEIHVLSGTTLTVLHAEEIVSIRRSFEEEFDLRPGFEIELRGGDLLRGILREDRLRIEGSQMVWEVPVTHFLAMQLPRKDVK